jgi:ribonuclease HI
MKNKSLIIHTDGGARGNPGPAASAFVVFDESKKETFKSGKYLGLTTNNVAEYSGVLQALQWLKNLPSDSRPAAVNFFLDSLLVVNQLNGIFKVKDSKLRLLILDIRSLETETGVTVSYHAVPREKNKEADLLVNQTLDRQLLT